MTTIHSAQDWESIRLIFLELYLGQNKSLASVRHELAEKHDFDASEKAYKKHITMWQAFKNYKAAEKEKVVMYMSSAQNRDKDVQTLLIRGKPIKWDRVHRHTRMKSSKQTRRPKQPVCTKNASIRYVSILPSTHIHIRIPDYLELRLRSAKQYLQWQLSVWACLPNGYMSSTATHHFIYGTFSDAIQYLSSRTHNARGWQLAHQCCEMIRTSKEANLYEMMRILVATVRLSARQDHKQLADMVFSYTRELLLLTLPTEHPFKQMLLCIAEAEDLQPIVCQLSMLKLDLFGWYRNKLSTRAWAYLTSDAIVDIANSGCFDEVEQRISKLLQMSSLATDQHIEVLSTKGYWLYEVNDYERAIAICKEAILVGEDALQTEVPPERSSNIASNMSSAYHSLSDCPERRGEIDEMMLDHERAFKSALMEKGKDDASTINRFLTWESGIRAHYRWAELSMLYERFGFMRFCQARGACASMAKQDTGSYIDLL